MHIPGTVQVYLLASDSIKLISIINSIYYPYVSERNEYPDKPVVSIDVSYAKGSISMYSGCDAEEWKLDEMYAVTAVSRFVQNNIQTIPQWNLLHGAALIVNGKTVLFLGRSETGKTTLTAYLTVMMKQLYISEDILIINYEKNELTPFPRDLNLRHGTIQLLRDTYSFEFPNIIPEKLGIYDRLIYKPENIVSEINRIDCIILLQRNDPTDCCTFELIDKSKIDIFLNSCYIPTNIVENFKSSIHLAEKNNLYLARYGDLGSFYEKLSELLK